MGVGLSIRTAVGWGRGRAIAIPLWGWGSSTVVEDLGLVGLCGSEAMRIGIWWFVRLGSNNTGGMGATDKGSSPGLSGWGMRVLCWWVRVIWSWGREMLGNVGRRRVVRLSVRARGKLLLLGKVVTIV